MIQLPIAMTTAHYQGDLAGNLLIFSADQQTFLTKLRRFNWQFFGSWPKDWPIVTTNNLQIDMT